jgi:hypothetical protein
MQQVGCERLSVREAIPKHLLTAPTLDDAKGNQALRSKQVLGTAIMKRKSVLISEELYVCGMLSQAKRKGQSVSWQIPHCIFLQPFNR